MATPAKTQEHKAKRFGANIETDLALELLRAL